MTHPESLEEIAKTVRNVSNRQVECFDRIATLEQRVESVLGRLLKIDDRLARREKITELRNAGYAR